MNEYLTACTDLVQEQGGTLDKYIGDAVVAMFGAPVALPDHALRACVATQLVQRRLGELRAKWRSEGDKWPEIVWGMQSRIGLNSGVATIGNMGSRTRFNYTMMGDNVNLAARMMARAGHGEIIAAPAIVGRTRTRFDARPVEPFMVKGKKKPVNAVALGPATTARAIGAIIPLVGREQEMRLLTATLDAARDGRRAIVNLVGDAGMGKSRIVEELKSRPGDGRTDLLPLLDHPEAQVRLNAANAVMPIAPDAARRVLVAISESGLMPQAGHAGMDL